MSVPDIQIAIPEGRLLKSVLPMLEASGLHCPERNDNEISVRIVSTQNALEMMANEIGFADICVVSSEAFLEEWIENWQYARDLQVARRRLSLLAEKSTDPTRMTHLKVATHYPLIARAHLQVDDVNLELVETEFGSSLTNMLAGADVVVDVIAEDEPLEQHGLIEVRRICPVSAHALVSQHTLDHKRDTVEYVLKRMMGLIDIDQHETRSAQQSQNAA